MFKNSKTSRSIRDKDFLKSAVYNYGLKALFIGLNLLMVPLLLSVLGKERFGIWQTILSVISFVAVLNFGLGNGLRNYITKLSLNNRENIGIAIGATYLKVSKIIIVALMVLMPLVYLFLKPKNIFANTLISSEEIKYSVLIFLFFFLINIILNLSNSIAFGLHKSYLTGLIQFIYLLICFLTIYILSINYHLNLIYVSLIFGLTQSLCYIFFLIYQNAQFKLKIKFKSNFDLSKITKLSYNFFLVQLLGLVFLTIDNFVISITLGPNETAEFSVVNKIYFTLINLFSVLLIHFWNSVTEAFEKREIKWILKTLKLLYLGSFGVLGAGLFISFFQKDILDLWLGTDVLQIAPVTFYLFSFYTFFHCLNAIFINLQNGLGILKLQIYSTLLALTIYVLGCYLIGLNEYGYNIIILLKIVAVVISIAINALILNKLKANDYTG